MRREHRAVHRALWPVLAVLVLLGLAAALWLRPLKPVTSEQKPVISRVASGDWSLITGHWLP
jgi:hypothetical protein